MHLYCYWIDPEANQIRPISSLLTCRCFVVFRIQAAQKQFTDTISTLQWCFRYFNLTRLANNYRILGFDLNRRLFTNLWFTRYLYPLCYFLLFLTMKNFKNIILFEFEIGLMERDMLKNRAALESIALTEFDRWWSSPVVQRPFSLS